MVRHLVDLLKQHNDVMTADEHPEHSTSLKRVLYILKSQGTIRSPVQKAMWLSFPAFLVISLLLRKLLEVWDKLIQIFPSNVARS
jgi:hypothetical protein